MSHFAWGIICSEHLLLFCWLQHGLWQIALVSTTVFVLLLFSEGQILRMNTKQMQCWQIPTPELICNCATFPVQITDQTVLNLIFKFWVFISEAKSTFSTTNLSLTLSLMSLVSISFLKIIPPLLSQNNVTIIPLSHLEVFSWKRLKRFVAIMWQKVKKFKEYGYFCKAL